MNSTYSLTPSARSRAEQILSELRRRSLAKTPPRTVSDSISWIAREFFIPEVSGPMPLADYQERVLREAYRKDNAGNFIYSVILWSDIKKSAKSCITAAVALERMTGSDWSSAKIIGNDIKQADSRTAFYARRAVELNPKLSQQISIKQYHLSFANHSAIEAIPIDPTGESGGNDDLIIYTEAWGLKDKKDLQMWEEMRLSPTKFGQSQIWVESYAGYEGESPMLWSLYEYGVSNGEQIDLGVPGLRVYRHGTQLSLWNDVPRLEWQTPEYYAAEASTLTESAFRRIHRNEWQSSLSKFVPDEWWAACECELPPLRDNQAVILVADAGVSNDCFGLLLVSRHDPSTVVRYARKWKPQPGRKLEYVNTADPDDTEFPEGEIRRLNREYNCVEFAYDPYQLHDMANRIRREVGINAVAFNQGQDRALADKQLYDSIRERRIMYTGEQDLSEHVRNANQKAEGDKMLRLVKRTDAAKIDLAVCLSMGNYRAIKLDI